MKIGCRAQCRNYRLSEDGKFFLEIGDQENFKSFLTLKNELRTPPNPIKISNSKPTNQVRPNTRVDDFNKLETRAYNNSFTKLAMMLSKVAFLFI